MKEHIPDTLPPLVVELPPDAYGVETTYVQKNHPVTKAIAERSFNMCCIAVSRNSGRIENAYPAHLGGMEQYQLLRLLAAQNNVSLQFPASDGK